MPFDQYMQERQPAGAEEGPAFANGTLPGDLSETQMPSEVVVVDMGGTHARFAIAHLERGRAPRLDDQLVLIAAEHASFQAAWQAYAAKAARPLPKAASIALAGPIDGEIVKLTNSSWTIHPARIGEELGLERFTLVNDFAAIAHAVAALAPDHLLHICGPEKPLPKSGVVSIVGPGTGLGVAALIHGKDGYDVLPTEAGHVEFAAVDAEDDAILRRLRVRFGRVSMERIVSGPGLVNVHEALAAVEGRSIEPIEERALWQAALAGVDRLAAAALGRLCMSLGSFAGDIALAHGAGAVVIAGGLGLRLAERLALSGFGERFAAKGRFEPLMRNLPVKLIVHPQPGLLGAAAAFRTGHRH